MARRTQDPITRFLNDYSSLDSTGRGQVSAAIRGFEYQGSTGGGGVKRTSPVTPRKTTTGNGTVTVGRTVDNIGTGPV